MGTIQYCQATVVAPGSTRAIVQQINLDIREQRTAIIGANGSGKSTLARMINGLVTATDGSVTVDGLDAAREGARVRRRVGFVFTEPRSQLVMPTVIEDVSLSLRQHVSQRRQRHDRAMDVLTAYGLASHAHDSVHTLSGGQQQMLALAGVLATEPSIIVADEPTTLLDLRNSAKIAQLLMNLDQQLVLVTHDLELAARCQRVLVVDDGTIAYDGSPDDSIAAYRRLALDTPC